MGKKFFYAVRKGKETGIFDNWDQCKENVIGFKGAEYKKFESLEEAKAFMENVELPKEEPAPLTEDSVIAYVDGSFNQADGKYGYGIVMIYYDNSIKEYSGYGSDENALSTRNVAGELMGTMEAIRRAYSEGFKTINIYHDYEGIKKWISGEWQANSPVSIAYVKYVEGYKDKININFTKVAAHTGVEYNERADKLAKEAVGI